MPLLGMSLIFNSLRENSLEKKTNTYLYQRFNDNIDAQPSHHMCVKALSACMYVLLCLRKPMINSPGQGSGSESWGWGWGCWAETFTRSATAFKNPAMTCAGEGSCLSANVKWILTIQPRAQRRKSLDYLHGKSMDSNPDYWVGSGFYWVMRKTSLGWGHVGDSGVE